MGFDSVIEHHLTGAGDHHGFGKLQWSQSFSLFLWASHVEGQQDYVDIMWLALSSPEICGLKSTLGLKQLPPTHAQGNDMIWYVIIAVGPLKTPFGLGSNLQRHLQDVPSASSLIHRHAADANATGLAWRPGRNFWTCRQLDACKLHTSTKVQSSPLLCWLPLSLNRTRTSVGLLDSLKNDPVFLCIKASNKNADMLTLCWLRPSCPAFSRSTLAPIKSQRSDPGNGSHEATWWL